MLEEMKPALDSHPLFHLEINVAPPQKFLEIFREQGTLDARSAWCRKYIKAPLKGEVTRRLYRSGESEYLIDGRAARLRDIQELFMGTGLGPESYAIIEQGRIGQILSNKPADRRAVIEEAAGIGKYKTRKRLAEAKLESAKQNLSRVFDILEEVGRQVNSLKRQASKAKRYEELRTEMVAHLRQAVSGRFRMLEREAAKLALDLNQAQSGFQGFAAQVTEKEREHGATREACYATEKDLTEARQKVAELNLESERTRGRLELQAKQKVAAAQAAVVQAQQDFVGYVRASMFGGTNVTRWISEHLRHDPPDSPDGRLGDAGIEFAQNLIAGRLELSESSAWLRDHLCRRSSAIYRTTEVGSSDGGA